MEARPKPTFHLLGTTILQLELLSGGCTARAGLCDKAALCEKEPLARSQPTVPRSAPGLGLDIGADQAQPSRAQAVL